jgi:CHASE3 domain sensor protein
MIAGLGTLLALAVLGIAIAVWLILDLRQAATDFTEQDVEYAAAIGDIALVSKTLANDERGFLISGSDEFLRQWEGRTAQVNEAFARAYANANPDQLIEVDRAKKSFDAWHEASAANMALFAAGQRDAAINASLEHVRMLRKEYEARLAGTQSLANYEIEAASAEVSDTVGRSVAILIGYLLVALVIGALVATWLLQSVAGPVRALVASRSSEEAAPPAVSRGQPVRSRSRSD